MIHENPPVRLGLFGLGGYAQQHLSVIRSLQDSGLCRLRAVVDPFPERQAESAAALASEGVPIYAEADALLARDDVDAVIVATPIQFHAPLAVQALRAGRHVYVEKPPCATLGEWEQMVAAQQSAGRVCAVGFQQQTSPALRFLKHEVVLGGLGRLQCVWAAIRWRRDDSYYGRAPWAGRLAVDGQPVFDGPATNALAHVVQAALFLAGETEPGYAEITRVRGSLRRARPIESYDSAYLEAETAGGAPVRLAFTHATDQHDEVVVRCVGTQGSASFDWKGRVALDITGQAPRALHFAHHPQTAVVLDFLRAVTSAGQPPATSIADTLPFLQMTNGAYRSSAGVEPFAAPGVREKGEHTAQRHYTVDGLDEQFAAFTGDSEQPPPLLDAGGKPWIDPAQIEHHLH